MHYLQRVLVACVLVGLCAELTEASEVAALADGPAQVDEAFRDAFQRAERRAEHHYAKTLLRHTYDKLNREGTDQIRRSLNRQLSHPLANEKPEDKTRRLELKRQLASTKAAIRKMTRRAHALHKGVKELLHDSKFDIEEESAAAVIRHEKRMLAKRNEEAAVAEALRATPEQKLGTQVAHETVHEQALSDDVTELKASMKLKCKHLRETNTRRAGHIKAQVAAVRSDQQAAEKSFQVASKHVDKMIKAFTLNKKKAREANMALHKAKFQAKRSKNKLLKLAEASLKPKKSPQKPKELGSSKQVKRGAVESSGESKVGQLIAKDDVAAAAERAKKMARLLGHSQQKIDRALKVMAAAKTKVTIVSADLRHHMGLEKKIISHRQQVESMCKPSKANKDTAFVVTATAAVAGNNTAPGPTVSQLLNETIGFAKKAKSAASKMKDQAALELASTQPAAPAEPEPAEDTSTPEEQKTEDQMKDEIDDEEEKAKKMHKHANSEAVKITQLTTLAKAEEPAQEELGDVQAETMTVVTLKQCRVAKVGRDLLCKQHGLTSQACDTAKDLYSKHC